MDAKAFLIMVAAVLAGLVIWAVIH